MGLLKNLLAGIEWLSDWQQQEYAIPDDVQTGPVTNESEAVASVNTTIYRLNAGKEPKRFGDEEIEYLRVLGQRVVDQMANHEIDCLFNAMVMCDSPIERIFISTFWLTCLSMYVQLDEGRPAVLINGEHSFGTPFGPNSITIEPQAKVGSYRVDFRLTRIQSAPDMNREENGIPGARTSRREIIVECDGHDFHEKTKEQAARDKARDRELQSVGYHVFHFTGSEIWNRPVQCAKEVIDVLDDWAKD